MATYKGIQGFSVQKLSEDPTASSDTEGQLWYNSGTGKFNIAVSGAGTWASGGALNNARKALGGIGIATAAVAMGGVNPLTTLVGYVEEYNGTAWTEVNNLPAATQFFASGGILTAGWMAGGSTSATGDPPFPLTTNEYDGTSWAASGNMTVTHGYGLSAGGPQTAAWAGTGAVPPPAPGGITACEEYNGSSWTAGGAVNTARYGAIGAGTVTAGIIAGGWPDSPATRSESTETYNGSSWTETNDLNTGRFHSALGGGTASTTSALVAGGYQVPSSPSHWVALTESWDGTSWSEAGDLASARDTMGAGTSGNTSMLAFGGSNPGPSMKDATEEFTAPVFSVKTVTVS